MEKTEGYKNYSEINPRLSHTLFSKTPSNFPKYDKKSHANTCLRRNVCSCKQNESTGNFERSSTRAQLCVSTFSSTESRRIGPTDIQPQSTKQICKNRTVSFDKLVPNSRLPTTQGLDVQDRFIPSLFSLKNSRIAQTIPTYHIRSKSVGNDMPSIWSEHSSRNFFHTNKLGCSNTKRKMEHENSSLSRRFFVGSSRCTNSSQPRQTGSKNITATGMAS